MEDLKKKIREIPDWPKKGINFKDITTLLADGKVFVEVINLLAKPFLDNPCTTRVQGKKIDKIVGIDARGFLIAAPIAYKLKCGLVIVRKPGKLPCDTIEKKYTLEYTSNTIQMHKDAILSKEKIVLIDDLIATGGTALAACDLIEELGGEILGISAIIDLPFLGGSEKLIKKGYKVRNLVSYESE